MKKQRSLGLWMAAGLLVSVAGCQTWFPEPGLTLPSESYLTHYPQHNPQTPPFPLPREQAAMELATAQQVGGPRPVQPGPGQP